VIFLYYIVLAADMKKEPKKHLRRHLEYLGDVKGKKIANLLGSCGEKAVPLAILGADVTVIDISEQNKNYAMEVAKEAGVNLTYIVLDFLDLDITKMCNSFDIAYMEGGILHYFGDLNEFSKKIYSIIKVGGKLVLNDFHPIRKIFRIHGIFATSGFIIDKLVEGPRFDSHKNIPGEFTLIASKHRVEK
jgi:2-polyprenyl-3-methyl-5-hydroxy-6-metoxy-1,4-benzoquinol methylase